MYFSLPGLGFRFLKVEEAGVGLIEDPRKTAQNIRFRIGLEGYDQQVAIVKVCSVPLLPIGKGQTFVENLLKKGPDLIQGHHVFIVFFKVLSRSFNGQKILFVFPAFVHFFMCRIGSVGNEGRGEDPFFVGKPELVCFPFFFAQPKAGTPKIPAQVAELFKQDKGCIRQFFGFLHGHGPGPDPLQGEFDFCFPLLAFGFFQVFKPPVR